MELFETLFVLVVVGGVALLYLVIGCSMLLMFLRGITRLRFTLRTLMVTVISGATCAALLANRSNPVANALGLICTAIYITMLCCTILEAGSGPTVSPVTPAPKTERDPTEIFSRENSDWA